MGKVNKTGRSKSEQRFLCLFHYMFATEAWKSLRAIDRAVYTDVARRYNGSNNGSIGYSVRQATQMGVSPATASRALLRLVERGFLVRETKGAFSRKIRHASEWRLTEHKCDLTGELATKDFVRWRPQ